MKSSSSKRLRVVDQRIRLTIIVLLAFVVEVSQAVEPECDLARLQDTCSCDRAWADAGFSLDVLNRSFPVPRGFRFVGIEMNLIVFRRTPKITGKMISRSPDDGDVSLQEKTVLLNRERASISYGEKRDVMLGDTGVSRKVSAFQWDGLDIFFWKSEGGNIVNTETYQAIVQLQGNDYEMAITSFDKNLISRLIACSK